MATINAIAHRNELTPDDYYLLRLVRNGTQTGANTQAGDTKSFTYIVAANTGIVREATITVKGTGAFTAFSKTFKVTLLSGTTL